MSTETKKPLSQSTPNELAAEAEKFTTEQQATLTELVKQKLLVGLPKEVAEEAARRQILRDLNPQWDVPTI